MHARSHRLDDALSATGSLFDNESQSIRSDVRRGSSLSVVVNLDLGFPFSMFSFARLGSGVPDFRNACIGSKSSVITFVNLKSSVSVRGFCHVGGEVSVAELLREVSV